MIEPADEQVQDGNGDPRFADAVAIQLWAPEQGVFAALRVERRPGAGESRVAALVVKDGEPAVQQADAHGPSVGDWARAAAGPVTLHTHEPLMQWSAGLQTPDVRLEFRFRALTAPVEETRVPMLRRYTQLCEIEGTIATNGSEAQLRGFGIRSHSWGSPAAGRRRFVTAATRDGMMVSVVAAGSEGAGAHGDELVAGQVLDPGSDGTAAPLEDVRLSTVYGPEGLPRSAGVELYRPGDELPARLSGEAIAGGTLELDGTAVTTSFFRWSLTGRPAWGTYESESVQ